MPCMGPDLDHAKRQGREITEAVLTFLKEKYHLSSGSLDVPNGRFAFKDELKGKLLAVIEEINVEDAAASF